MGFWLCFTLIFFQKVKNYRQFNSPHNTSFFILGPITIGIFYSIWGYFTGIFEWNLFGGFSLYLSPWTLIFAFPYLSYGMFSLYSCFQRYDLVYIGQKPISARGFGYFVTTLYIFLGFASLLFFIVVDSFDFPLDLVHISPDIVLLVTSFLSIFVLFRYGIFGGRPSLSQISATASTPSRPVYQPPPRPRSSPPPASSRSRTTSTSRSSSSTRPRASSSQPAPSRTSQSSTTDRSQRKSADKPKLDEKSKKEKLKLLKQLRPKAGTLSLDDFKCIFCFQLPKYPEDKGRGIVICPKCNHPSHADEFREWTKNSNLCSRCDSPLPARFLSNPEIISVRTYAAAIKIYSKKIKS